MRLNPLFRPLRIIMLLGRLAVKAQLQDNMNSGSDGLSRPNKDKSHPLHFIFFIYSPPCTYDEVKALVVVLLNVNAHRSRITGYDCPQGVSMAQANGRAIDNGKHGQPTNMSLMASFSSRTRSLIQSSMRAKICTGIASV